MVTILSSHQQNTMVSTLNVLLLTLNKALPRGRLRITRNKLMPICKHLGPQGMFR